MFLKQDRREPVKNSDNSSVIFCYIVCFMLYSVIGWCYEVFLEVVVYQWGFSNRGVLHGPYTPVYGFGALAFILLVYPLIKDKDLMGKVRRIPLVFILCMGIATGIELLTSYILEYFTGAWPWQTYAYYKYNFQARIALSPSIRFGLGGLLFLYILQPFFERVCSRLGPKITKRLAGIIVCILFLDGLTVLAGL